MKNIVIYFSQTGNTEKVARAIETGIKQFTGHCDIVKIKDANPRKLYEYDLIGLGSPIMHFEEPGNVRAFIKDMRFVGGKHFFVFNTHGTHPEYYFPSIYPRLKQRGVTIIGMRDWYGDCPFNVQPYPTFGHPDEIDLKEARDFGREMVERSRRIAAGEINLIQPPPPEPEMTQHQVEEMLKPKHLGKEEVAYGFRAMMEYVKEKCTYPECRLCMDNCPMDGIDLSVKPPIVGTPCISCAFCEKICPTGAISEGAYRASAGGNPETMRAFFLEPLVLIKAEAEGWFRRLIPREKVGTSPPIDRNKHPKWVIGKGLA
jgi:flavodoxin/Fe-S-cluster-containing hydrogenase component 2